MKNVFKFLGVIVVAVVVSLVVALIVTHTSTTSTLGAGQITTVGDVNPNGIGLGGFRFSQGGGVIRASTKSNQAFWRNTLGRPVYVDYAEVSTDGVASTSYKIYVATSTSSTITNNFTAPFAGLINGFTIATSTAATTTSNYTVGPGRGAVQVADGAYVIVQLQQANTQNCTGATCETATSTNRGFNLQWRLRFHD